MKTFEPSCMKTIGLIGGMSWESSKLYYEAINQHTKRLLGGSHSARCVMVSVDFADIERLTFQRRWDCIGGRMARSAMQLQHAGADVVVLCTNTIHRVSHAISRSIDIPFLHIAQTTAEAIKAQGLSKVALLGTRFTMEEDFYTSVLAIQHGLDVIIPPMFERQEVHDIIYKELVKGKFTLKARQKVQHIMAGLKARGAQGVILGCTELPILIQPGDTDLPTFDTGVIHAQKAVEWALAPCHSV